jgi:protein-tyrosine phosphatase
MTSQGYFSSRSVDGGIDEIPLSDLHGVSGRMWLCGKHVVGPDPEAALDRVGATTIVCLNLRHELEDRYPLYVAWLEAHAPVQAIWFPTPDLSMRPLGEARPILDNLAERLRNGERMIVHCAAGIGRSGTTAVALLMLLGSTRLEALAVVAQHRPMAGPEAGQQRMFINDLAASL